MRGMWSSTLNSRGLMSDIPIAKNRRTSYENFVAVCPECGRDSIFNRASDLHTFEPIAGREVACLSGYCRKPFRIINDSVNNAHEMLIFDCYELIERKHYMNCILSLAQAYEVFFSFFFRVEFLYKPFRSAYRPTREEVEAALEETRSILFPLSNRLQLDNEFDW